MSYIDSFLSDDDNVEKARYSDSSRQFNEDRKLLLDMGFDIKMIKKIYYRLRPRSIEEAIEFLSEIDGIYQHQFDEDKNERGKCFLCGKEQMFHIGYEPQEKISLSVIEPKDPNKEYGTCCVCEDDDVAVIHTDTCSHTLCYDCWFEYIKSKINEANVSKMPCPGHECKEILKEEFILSFIDTDRTLKNKYTMLKAKADVLSDPNKKFCPEPNCKGVLVKTGKDKYVECEFGHKICFVCLCPWHGKKKCKEEQDKDFQLWKQGKHVKRCPKCKIYTEKNEGCNHMTCVECKFQWCWLCERAYYEGHFSYGSCKGMQFKKTDELPSDRKEILEEELQMKCFYCFRYIRPLYEDELRTNCYLTYLFAIFCFVPFSIYYMRKEFNYARFECFEGVIFTIIGVIATMLYGIIITGLLLFLLLFFFWVPYNPIVLIQNMVIQVFGKSSYY